MLEVAARADVPVSCAVSTSFGCPFEGDVPVDRLERVVSALVGMGARAIALADTTGMANPRQVTAILERFVPSFPGVEWTLHTHDTRALAIPNILAAMACGVTHFDSSIGGLGGCPFAPGASGNVCTEDLVHGLHAMGVETGIDVDRLLAVSRRVQESWVASCPASSSRPAPRRGAIPSRTASRPGWRPREVPSTHRSAPMIRASIANRARGGAPGPDAHSVFWSARAEPSHDGIRAASCSPRRAVPGEAVRAACQSERSFPGGVGCRNSQGHGGRQVGHIRQAAELWVTRLEGTCLRPIQAPRSYRHHPRDLRDAWPSFETGGAGGR